MTSTATCLAAVLAGLDQPAGRAPGTPGGEAAVRFLVETLDEAGLAAPPRGRIQPFPLGTRCADPGGTLRVRGGPARTAGDGWWPVPGSFARDLDDVRAVGTDALRALVPAGASDDSRPLGWALTDPAFRRTDPLDVQIVVADEQLILGRFDLDLRRRVVNGQNVLAWIPGSGALADQVILVGAHHDHLPPLAELAFPGADDNASGVAATVCGLVAYASAAGNGPRRSVLGVWFDGEEDGLWGSQAFVADPPVPIDALAAVLIADMVGRLGDASLGLVSTRDHAWADLLWSSAFQHDLSLRPSLLDGHFSDDLSFTVLGLPTAHLFTGLHDDYHQPGDRVERLDFLGLERVTAFVAASLGRLATSPTLPPRGGDIDMGIRLGGASADGFPRVGAVLPRSAAWSAGIRPGEVVGCNDLGEPVVWLTGRLPTRCFPADQGTETTR